MPGGEFTRPRRQPGWWPENEPWPPRRWGRRRRPVGPGGAAFRFFGFLFFMLFIPATVCIGTLWLLGLLGQPDPGVSTVALLGLGLLVLVAFIGMFTGFRRVALPLGDLIEAARQVESGDYSARVEPHGSRELRTLAGAFNDMAERLQLTEQQRRDFVADLTHELRTPVSIIQGNLEGMLDEVYPVDDQHLAPVLEETKQLSRLIDDLRTLSESESGTLELHREPTDLGVLAAEVAHSFRVQADEAEVHVEVQIPDDLPLVDVDPTRVREVLVNLTSNALRHSSKGDTITTSAVALDGYAQVTVQDEGSGMTAHELERVFERFYKSDGSGGSGLGLTIARNLVKSHGGEIAIESAPETGTTVRFTLPLDVKR